MTTPTHSEAARSSTALSAENPLSLKSPGLASRLEPRNLRDVAYWKGAIRLVERLSRRASSRPNVAQEAAPPTFNTVEETSGGSARAATGPPLRTADIESATGSSGLIEQSELQAASALQVAELEHRRASVHEQSGCGRPADETTIHIDPSTASIPTDDRTLTVTNPTSSSVSAESEEHALLPSTSPLLRQPVKSDKGLYVGSLKYLRPPESLRREWREAIQEKLVIDLSRALAKPSLSYEDQIFEPELCMAGFISTSSVEAKLVRLEPTVWISCITKKSRNLLRREVKHLKYLHDFSIGKVQVQLSGPRPATAIPITRRNDVLEEHSLSSTLEALSDEFAGPFYALLTFFAGVIFCLIVRIITVIVNRFTTRRIKTSELFDKIITFSLVVIILPIYLLYLGTMAICRKIRHALRSRPPYFSRSLKPFLQELEEYTTLRPFPRELEDYRTLIPPSSNPMGSSSTSSTISNHAGETSFPNSLPFYVRVVRQKIDIEGTSPLASACGLTIRVSPSDEHGEGEEQFCTLGGLFRVGNKILGLSTGHTFFEGVALRQDDCSSTSVSDIDDSSSDSDEGSRGESEPNNNAAMPLLVAKGPRKQSYMYNHEKRWGGSATLIQASFQPFEGFIMKQDRKTKEVKPYPEKILGSDFALLNLAYTKQMFNEYFHQSHSASTTIEGELKDEDLVEGSIFILSNQGGITEGYLLAESSVYVVKGCIFRTRKIELSSHLPSGSSGSWVVRNDKLCGCIVASYEASLYAHMLTVEKICSDISASTGCEPVRVATREDLKQWWTAAASLAAKEIIASSVDTSLEAEQTDVPHRTPVSDDHQSKFRLEVQPRPSRSDGKADSFPSDSVKSTPRLYDTLHSTPETQV